MNCKQARRIIVAGTLAGNDELSLHLAGCPKCSQLEEIVTGLEQIAGQDRQLDLSSAAIRETQLLAAALLTQNRKLAIRPPAIFSLRFLSRPVMTALAAASVLIAVGVFGWRHIYQQPASGTKTLSHAEITAMNSQISLLAGHIDSDLRGFRNKYRETDMIGSVEAMSAALNADIASRAMDVQSELR